ncbi:PadR family transcriptional regulator [Lawsonibacter sp. LCP25S3_G6]|uniref:PadR family transcriptional regulator n=1 Tax=unclassified Lawsonibacter TaxID=2617946 RepID=UPI003F99D0AB
MKLDKGLMAGSSTMLVLTLLESGDMYGYQMIEELSRRSNQVFQMQEGTLYPILHTLEKGKYLSSYEQQAPTGRMRKYYKLTRKGRELLTEKKSEWEKFHRGVEDVLSGGANALSFS